jgi:hypothetical protein
MKPLFTKISLIITSVILLSALYSTAQNNVGIGTTLPNSKAILELKATDKGFLAPRLTDTEMLAITTSASTNGLLVYNTTYSCFYYWNNTTLAWKSMCASSGIGNSGDTVVINILKVDTAYIKTIITNYIKADSAFIKLLTTQYIKSDSAYIKLFRADTAFIKLLVTKYIKSDSAYIKLLRADSIFTNYLLAHYIKTDSIKADFGRFDSLYVGGKNILNTINDSITKQAWLLKGNTALATNKLGTLNPTDLHIVTNNTERITINNATGNIGINTTNPQVALHIATIDGIAVPTGTTAQQPLSPPTGTMRFNTTLSTMEVYNGTAWLNINTPPIGATYTQWLNAADPNAIYPNTTWTSSDMQNGEFLRATGGAANVAAGGTLTGTLQTDAVQDHNHAAISTANGSGALTTTTDGAHDHNWGGNWSTDNSGLFDAGSGNGDGNGNTFSDGSLGFWGGTSTGLNYIASPSFAAGAHSHTVNSPLLSNDVDRGGAFSNFSLDNISPNTTSVDGNHAHNIAYFAHRHWIKSRPTTTTGAHFHTLPDHAHTINVSVTNMSTGNIATETRPTNVAVKYWRRTN